MKKTDIKLEYHPLCKAIVRGSGKSIAGAILKSSSVRHHILSLICQDLEKECKILSGRKHQDDSPFCRRNISHFSLSTASAYLQANSPIFYKLLSQCTKLSRATGNSLKTNEKRQMAAVVVAASILINGRNPTQNALQSIIAVVLHAGHAQKMVSIL